MKISWNKGIGLAVVVFLMTLLFSIPTLATTSLGTISKVEQIAATNTSVTLDWTAATGAEKYWIYYYQNDIPITKIAETSATTITINNLNTSLVKQYAIMIYPVRTLPNGTPENTTGRGLYVQLLPNKVSGFKISAGSPETNQIGVEWKPDANAGGYEIVFYNNKGKKVKTQTISYLYKAAIVSGIKPTIFYKASIRAFVNLSKGKAYGAKTDIYLANQVSPKYDLVKNNIRISWKKVAGSTNYTIYTSTNGKKFKKVTTTKKTSYTFSKINKKKIQSGKTYYFKIVTNKKVKKKTYSSSKNSYLKLYVF